MDFYLPQHCYNKASKFPFEGNLLVMNKDYLFEGETPSNQLWIGLEEGKKHVIALPLEDGIRRKKRKSDFFGVMNFSHLQEKDSFLMEQAQKEITSDDYLFWSLEKFPEERYSSYRIVTQIGKIILAIHLNDTFYCEYSIWEKKQNTFQMLQNWGGDYENAKLSFAMECGFMKESDLPKGG